MRTANSFTIAFSIFGIFVGAAHAAERKLSWNCGERGVYGFGIDDAGHGTPSGNALPGTNRLLFVVTLGTDIKGARFQLSAYVDNKLYLQMPSDAQEVIEIEVGSDGAPRSLNAAWIDLSGSHSIVMEKSPKTWRFVHTTTNIFDEGITKATNGTAGPSVSIVTGDCVLNP